MSPIVKNIQGEVRPSEIERIVKALHEGGVAIIATDTVYGLIAEAFNETAFVKLNRIKGERRMPFIIVFESTDSFTKWFGEPNLLQSNVIHELLPGPVTLIFKSVEKIPNHFHYHEFGTGIRVSSDPLLKSICRSLEKPVWATSVNRTSEPAPVSFQEIQPSILSQVEMAYDSGPTAFRQASTVVDIRALPFRILRKGPWMKRVEHNIQRTEAPVKILVVCTGNICRSPIAAALLQKLIENGVDTEVQVSSAGTASSEGYPASVEMVDIAESWGIDMTSHRSRSITVQLIDSSDLILAVTRAHRDFLLSFDSGAGYKIRLLGELIGVKDIEDPYQLNRKEYEESAKIIHDAVEKWAVKLRDLIPARPSVTD